MTVLKMARYFPGFLALFVLAACQSKPQPISQAQQPSSLADPSTNAAGPSVELASPTQVDSTASPSTNPSPAPASRSKIIEDKPVPLEQAAEGVHYSAEYDDQLKRIFEMADKNRWEEAEQLAIALYEKDPQDPTVERVLNWTSTQRRLLRAQAVEDRIRQIDAKHSVFNPSIRDLLTEQKDRGLPPRKDLRDAIEQLEAIPYVPASFGKTIQQRGTLFDVETSEGRMTAILDKEISVHLNNVTLEAIIFNIGQAEGINFVADRNLPAFKQSLSVNLDRVKVREFLRFISRNMDLQFQAGNDLIWIVDGSDPSKLLEETRFYRLRKGFVIPAQFGASEVDRVTVTQKDVVTVTERQKIEKFVNDGAPDVPSIEAVIKQFFTGSKYLIDYERNLIVARGTPEQLEVMERIIEEFDKPVQQVLIEARFITVSEAAFLQLGAAWETGREFLPGGRSPTDFTGLNIAETGLGLQETFTNILGRQNLSVTLSALQQSGESQTLSAPRLTLVNNLPGTISDGKVQYYYEEYTVKQQVVEQAIASTLVPQGRPTKLRSGVTLEVVASIGGDGKSILLALRPQVNQDVRLVTFASVVDPTGSFEIRLPESRTQELATRVVVRSGQTVVMGGVMEREQSTFVESVPILGNLPIVGAAFRRRTEVDRPRYLLIFVTATLLSESGEFLIFEDDEF
jgi:type IV pilus assembly protein PilQ